MKKIKKLLCIMLAVLLLVSSGAAAASAEEPAGSNLEELHQKFIAYLEEQGVAHEFNGIEDSTVEYIAEINGWTVFYGTAGATEPAYVSERIGKYVFVQSSYCHPYKIGLYAEKGGKVYTLKDTYETGTFNLDELAGKTEHSHIEVYFPGDIDLDGTVSVSDVLKVQKVIAKQDVIIEFIDLAFYDFDSNGKINVSDVLDMQKKIAKVTA